LNKALEKDRTRLTVNGFTQLIGRDDAQATRECRPRSAKRATATGAVKGRADDLLRDPARNCARGEAVQARDRILTVSVIDVSGRESQSLASWRLRRQAYLAAGRTVRRSSTVSF
jgi:hypothetical protein